MNGAARVATALGVLVVAGALVTGCTSDTSTAQASQPTISATPVVAGQALPAGAEVPVGLKAMELPDGTSVAVSPDEPLPEIARAALIAEELGVKESFGGASAGQAAALAQVGKGEKRAAEASAASGRNVVLVFQTWGGDDAGKYGWAWTSSVLEHQWATWDKTAKIAEVEAWIGSQPNPDTYDLVVAE